MLDSKEAEEEVRRLHLVDNIMVWRSFIKATQAELQEELLLERVVEAPVERVVEVPFER